ncbi:hypothetical protein [Edaphobacter modestus]|uniref:Uncharacterized protein n=1 Tax=Edaphobacter modestus TaxID=388466 RepID=A0A4Q7Y1A9_9BACT|nr:hypothetical protein [Edaphobacter modestus]RZU29811.1 hypothetical protein BDD14_6444 [Edaphobacter modestus]
MSQATKGGFAYLKHAKQTGPTEIVGPPEVQPEPAEIVAPGPPAREGRIHPVAADWTPEPVRTAAKQVAKPPREKFTTAIDADIRDAVAVELAKLRRTGLKQTPADLINDLLRKWLLERGASI